MNKTIRCVDLFGEGQPRKGTAGSIRLRSSPLYRFEDMFQQRNWIEFAHIYCRASSASQRAHYCNNDVVKPITIGSLFASCQAFRAPLLESRQFSQWRILDGAALLARNGLVNGVGAGR